MSPALSLIPPRFVPPLEPEFRPAVLTNRAFRQEVAASGRGVPLAIGLERPDGRISRFDTVAFPDGHPRADANLAYAERLVKFLLWARGGWRVTVGGPRSVGEHIARTYAPGGARAFDYHFMGEQVYGRPFTVAVCRPEEVPAAREGGQPLGRHLEGGRIGFDLGASDVKVSAVLDGEAIFSEEIVWEPTAQADPDYHYRHILSALKLARAKLPRLDAIGGSSAGVIVDNRPMVASLFRGVPKDRFHEVHDIFLRIRDEFGVPLEVVNDGDVTALAGAMSLEDYGRPRHRARLERGGWLRRPGRRHHRLAERTRVRTGRFQPGRGRRRVVGRYRRRCALLLAAVRLPPRAEGRHRSAAGRAEGREAEVRAGTTWSRATKAP